VSKYTLEGKDGNAYAIIGYTAESLKRVGLADIVDAYIGDAESQDYNHLLYVSQRMIRRCNQKHEEESS